MTSPNAIPADAVLVAIDIAKACNEVLIEAPAINVGAGCRSSTAVRSIIGWSNCYRHTADL
jgi:hypothetical protein